MNRIGLDGDNDGECESVIRSFMGVLNVRGIFTHLCAADTDDEESRQFTDGQIRKFQAIACRVADLNLPFVHCFNSAGGMFYIHSDAYSDIIKKIVRLGIVLYGLKPDESNHLPETRAPAMTWKSVVSMVKTVYPGETIGYGRSYKVERESRIATVTTGYADGLNRLLSNKGFMMFEGKKLPIVGRICMDQTLLDVTDIPEIEMGSVVTILGKSGELEYTADQMASDLGTIGYEVICNITKRVQRFYKTHGLLYSL